jgi:hypothetical protein
MKKVSAMLLALLIASLGSVTALAAPAALPSFIEILAEDSCISKLRGVVSALADLVTPPEEARYISRYIDENSVIPKTMPVL